MKPAAVSLANTAPTPFLLVVLNHTSNTMTAPRTITALTTLDHSIHAFLSTLTYKHPCMLTQAFDDHSLAIWLPIDTQVGNFPSF